MGVENFLILLHQEQKAPPSMAWLSGRRNFRDAPSQISGRHFKEQKWKKRRKKKNRWLNITARNASSPDELQPSRQKWCIKDLPSDKAFFQLNKTWCVHHISCCGISDRQLLLPIPNPTARHQLRSHWSNTPETITGFDSCFQVSFESQQP